MALILIVDDEPDMRLALGTVLRKQGHSIVEAGDGESALVEIGKRPVELMLLDIRLPGMDGVQVLKRARQNRSDLPIVMLTGYGSVDTAVKLMQSGADGYLAKPFSNQRLLEIVEKSLAAHRLSADPLHRELAEKLSPVKTAVRPSRPITAPAHPHLSRTRRVIDIMAAFAVAALFFYMDPLHWRQETAPIVSMNVPFSNPTSLVWRSGELWVSDWVTQSVFRMRLQNGGLEEMGSIPLPKTHVTGFTFAGQDVYTCDSWRHVIQRRNLDSGLSVVKEFKSPGPNPSGLYWDGHYLWSLDSTLHKIFQHDPSSLAILASYPSPGKAPVGLMKIGEYFWSADADTRRFYKHRQDAQFTVLAKYDLDQLDAGSEQLSAFTEAQGIWWIGRDGRNAILRLPFESLRAEK